MEILRSNRRSFICRLRNIIYRVICVADHSSGWRMWKDEPLSEGRQAING